MDTAEQLIADTRRDDFIELVGQIVQAEGLPRNAGRLMGLFIYDGGQKSFGEIAEALHISRGSVSSSTRLMEDLGLIRRRRRKGERQDYFELEGNPYASLLERASGRARKAKESIERMAEGREDAPETKSRMKDFANFYRTVEACICRAHDDIAKGRP